MKQYVEVYAKFDTEGNIKPLAIKIDDDKYEVDRIKLLRLPRCHIL